jgi:hypothetical protein
MEILNKVTLPDEKQLAEEIARTRKAFLATKPLNPMPPKGD